MYFEGHLTAWGLWWCNLLVRCACSQKCWHQQISQLTPTLHSPWEVVSLDWQRLSLLQQMPTQNLSHSVKCVQCEQTQSHWYCHLVPNVAKYGISDMHLKLFCLQSFTAPKVKFDLSLFLADEYVGWFWSLVTCDQGPFLTVYEQIYKDFAEDATHGILSGIDVGTFGTSQPQVIRWGGTKLSQIPQVGCTAAIKDTSSFERKHWPAVDICIGEHLIAHRICLHFGSYTSGWIGYSSPQNTYSFTLQPQEVITGVTVHCGNLEGNIPNAGRWDMVSAFTFYSSTGKWKGPVFSFW